MNRDDVDHSWAACGPSPSSMHDGGTVIMWAALTSATVRFSVAQQTRWLASGQFRQGCVYCLTTLSAQWWTRKPRLRQDWTVNRYTDWSPPTSTLGFMNVRRLSSASTQPLVSRTLARYPPTLLRLNATNNTAALNRMQLKSFTISWKRSKCEHLGFFF